MKLLRPYIPISVRIQVAERQLFLKGFTPWELMWWRGKFTSQKAYLGTLLIMMFGTEKYHLDHDPALENRQKLFDRGVHVAYSPPANDPECLIYREKHAHHIKTNVRGDGAQYPDRVLANRERKRNRAKKKYNWPSRPFPNRKKLDPSVRLSKLKDLRSEK